MRCHGHWFYLVLLSLGSCLCCGVSWPVLLRLTRLTDLDPSLRESAFTLLLAAPVSGGQARQGVGAGHARASLEPWFSG